jgi:hypothetical protein
MHQGQSGSIQNQSLDDLPEVLRVQAAPGTVRLLRRLRSGCGRLARNAQSRPPADQSLSPKLTMLAFIVTIHLGSFIAGGVSAVILLIALEHLFPSSK